MKGRQGEGAVRGLLAALLIVALAGALVGGAPAGAGAAVGARDRSLTAETTSHAITLGGGTIYVDWEAGGANDGSSWSDAFTDLQAGLAAALAGDEVWVAAGTYYPGTYREDSFAMVNQVAIYGGFDPTVGDVDWEHRDWVANETVLSGDIGIPGDNADNCYHVFRHPPGTDLDGTAILDGFTITGGNANVPVGPDFTGGGMFNASSSPTVTNCTFVGNLAAQGAGMHNYQSSPALTNCTFESNSADIGGGMHNLQSAPLLTNCTFCGNSADLGGGMYNDWSSPPLTNCTFSGNSALVSGGGMYNVDFSFPELTNCVLWGDTPDEIALGAAVVTYSDIQGGYTGEGNIDADPLFVDPGNGDYHLSAGSPCIDTGTNDAPDLPPYDFEGDDRIIDGDGDTVAIVDMGIDEFREWRVYLPLALRAH